MQALEHIPNVQELTQQLEQQHDKDPPKEHTKPAAINENNLGPPAPVPLVQPIQPDPVNASPPTHILVSGTTPRAKLELSFYPQSHSIRLCKGADSIQLRSTDVKYCIWFPKREDCLQTPKRHKSFQDRIVLPGSMVMWVLHPNAMASYKGKRLHQICIQLEPHVSDPLPAQYFHQEDAYSILQLAKLCTDSYHTQLYAMMRSTLELSPAQLILAFPPQYQPFTESRRYRFVSEKNGSSSTVSSGMPWLTCHKGVQDGVLYPLKEGLLFFKYVLEEVEMVLALIFLIVSSLCSFFLYY